MPWIRRPEATSVAHPRPGAIASDLMPRRSWVPVLRRVTNMTKEIDFRAPLLSRDGACNCNFLERTRDPGAMNRVGVVTRRTLQVGRIREDAHAGKDNVQHDPVDLGVVYFMRFQASFRSMVLPSANADACGPLSRIAVMFQNWQFHKCTAST